MDESKKSSTAGARGERAVTGAQRHTSLTDPVTRPALSPQALRTSGAAA